MSGHDAAASLVRKLWQYCNVLRDDGLSYPDYVEQLTYLLFLKMSDEQGSEAVPADCSWSSLVGLDAPAMHRHYSVALSALGSRGGMLGLVFRNARNKIRDPAKLRLLVLDLIGTTEWMGLSADLKGDAYEGLLEKNARDTKSGAGQYFTPRPLTEAVVECIDPRPGEVVCDPACGTAGFLLAAQRHIQARNPGLTRAQRRHLATRALRGTELVEEVARLAAMNLLLHGISGGADDELPIVCEDSLHRRPQTKADVVLSNPPFGVKGSVTYAKDGRSTGRALDELTIVRPDFWVRTANKQLNFLQHISSLLKPGGRAAVVVPDNVLFEAGAAAAVRRRLVEEHDVHTLLRLPTGLFYAQGVKANVLFFDKPKARSGPSKPDLWVYDLRSANRFTLKTKPLQRSDLAEFVRLYRPGDTQGRASADAAGSDIGRWQRFSREAILAHVDCRLDLMPEVGTDTGDRSGTDRIDEISRLIAEDLAHALRHLALVSHSTVAVKRGKPDHQGPDADAQAGTKAQASSARGRSPRGKD
ncbi:class I SAM-dependent DNA methyltransferase [Sediminicoccus rosea]|uniref:site-specific DNA-methyltransferase (adenine-specific) n=1 Tax=Sediminicoccus rosea TaxID=1225128 RepID=A0ABZ0PMF8_9PROT|nr:class I SAM-dependent DNA methyltransferase [Sediminicoccus rosea]WPB86925.1 class I SAM-dependent DNA methyltransferase [Sediminicoccus rosea]